MCTQKGHGVTSISSSKNTGTRLRTRHRAGIRRLEAGERYDRRMGLGQLEAICSHRMRKGVTKLVQLVVAHNRRSEIGEQFQTKRKSETGEHQRTDGAVEWNERDSTRSPASKLRPGRRGELRTRSVADGVPMETARERWKWVKMPKENIDPPRFHTEKVCSSIGGR